MEEPYKKIRLSRIVLVLISVILITITLTNCNQCDKTECTDDNTNRITNVVKNYFYFKTGSWWVYENEISLERDSIYVIGDVFKRSYLYENCGCKDQMLVQCNTNLNDTIFYTTHSNSGPSVAFSRGRYNSSYDELTYRFRVQDDTTLSLSNQHNAIITFLPVYKGIKEEFKNVYRCFYNKALTDYLSDSYFAPHVGLIRYCYKDGDQTYWNLINYNIIQ